MHYYKGRIKSVFSCNFSKLFVLLLFFTTINGTFLFSQCTYSISLYDYGGNGWQGGKVTVYVNGIAVSFSGSTDLTISSGYGNSTYAGGYPFSVNNGDIITTTYTAGTSSAQNEYRIYNSNGGLLQTQGNGQSITPGNVYGLIATCSLTTPTVQDCWGAIPVCQTTYNEVISYSGTGAVVDVPTGLGCPKFCLGSGEMNGVWYRFTAQTTGLLDFRITPYNSSDDYDWALFNLTSNSCSDLPNINSISPNLQISCNWTDDYLGITGANSLTPSSGSNCVGTGWSSTKLATHSFCG